MENILVLTHADETGSALTKASLEAISAGRDLAARLSASLSIGIVADQPEPLSKAPPARSARCFRRGLRSALLRLRRGRLRSSLPRRKRGHRSRPSSSRFARVMAGVSHRLGGIIDTHITALGGSSSLEATRWYYRQRVEAVVTRAARPWFLLLEPGIAPAFAAGSESAELQVVDVQLPAARTTVTGIRAPKQDEQTIRPDAKLLFVAGAGWTKKQPDGQIHAAEASNLILGFLRATGASLGSSKSLVDQGSEGQPVLPFLTHLNQIGQTGATPRHAKGLATCCHGEEPHVVGWRFIGSRRAVSLDPNCGWTRGKADVVYIADAFEVIGKLNALLTAAP